MVDEKDLREAATALDRERDLSQMFHNSRDTRETRPEQPESNGPQDHTIQ